MLYKRGNTLGGGYILAGKKINSLYKKGEKIYSSKPKYKIVDFATGTDEEISAMLEAHYKGVINISDYWKVGDTRVVHINAMLQSTISAHAAQDMTMVIMDFNHDDLATPIGKRTKAAVSVGFREIMGNYAENETCYYWGKVYYPVSDNGNYSLTPLRTWLNGDLLNALPSTFSPMIKEVNKKNLAYHTKTDDAPLITQDKIWLLSYPEVYGTEENPQYLNNGEVSDYEGIQYEYMKTRSNRTKGYNMNGKKGNNCGYWLRSPSSAFLDNYGYYWCVAFIGGSLIMRNGNDVSNLAPAFCL